MVTDERLRFLIAAACDGDASATRELFECVVYPMTHAIMRPHEFDPDALEDLVQEVATRAFKSLHTVRARTRGEFRAYLRRIGHNALIDRLRRKPPGEWGTYDTSGDERPLETSPEWGAEHESIWEDLFGQAVDLMYATRPDCVETLLILVKDSPDGTQWREILGRSDGASRTHVWSCRKLFGQILERLRHD